MLDCKLCMDIYQSEIVPLPLCVVSSFLTIIFFYGWDQGHFGFIELPTPIYHPSHVTELRKMLNMCFSCLQFKTCKVPPETESSCSHCQVN